MQLIDYPAKVFAYELTERCSSDWIEKIADALVDAPVDLSDAQDEVEPRRDQLIARFEAQLEQKVSTWVLFFVGWRVT